MTGAAALPGRSAGRASGNEKLRQPVIVWRSPRPQRPVLTLVKLILTLVTALLLGLGATLFSLQRPSLFGAVRAGVWTVWPKIGSLAIDPYQRAAVARSGDVPLGLSEGLMFLARTDDAGALLSGECVYRIAGPVPAGRFWTLTPILRNGSLIPNAAKRYGFTSQEIVRDADGKFEIVLGRAAVPGNWLPLGSVGRFDLALRIYDTTLSATAATLDKTLMPSITRGTCG